MSGLPSPVASVRASGRIDGVDPARGGTSHRVESVARDFALEDATPLAHAYVHAVAKRANVRLLSIKGPAAEHHAVRAPHVAADADVLVEPGLVERLLTSLRAAGWRERERVSGAEEWVQHSVTLIHDGWPCDLDVHHVFPGFLRDPVEVFDLLWANRDTVAVAGNPLSVPCRDATILITALHSIRSADRIARHAEELAGLRGRFAGVFNDGDRASLEALAHATGCVETLDGALQVLGVNVADRISRAGRSQEALVAWRERVAAGSVPTYFWLRQLEMLSWRARPRALLRMLWPNAEFLRTGYPDLSPGRSAADRERLRRLGRGMRDLIRVFRARVSARTRSWRDDP